ncbi:hypothetical protein ES703_21253 [subsurface metagenome]
MSSGDLKHVAKGGDEVPLFSEFNRLVDFRRVRYTNWAAGAANHFEPIGKK